MKRKIFSAVLAFVMLLTLAPVALAQGETGPYVTNFTFTNNGTEYSTSTGDHVIELDNGTLLEHVKFSVTFNEAVEFVVLPDLTTDDEGNYVPGSAVPRGGIYVTSASDTSVSVNLNMDTGTLDFNSPAFSLTLTTEDHIVWTGNAPLYTPEGEESPVKITILDLARNLYNPVTITAGSAKSLSTGETSLENNIIMNYDSEKVYIREGGPGVEIATVTYVCNGDTIVWKAPVGSNLMFPAVPAYTGFTFTGHWYSDSSFTNEVTTSTVVTGNTTVYAKYDSEDPEKTFLEKLTTQTIPVVTISSKEEFLIFAAQGYVMNPGRIARLGDNLDFTGVDPISAIQFHANFDGAGYSISNAVFAATADGVNAGMFAEIGRGQVIANLTLKNITVQNATNAGTVAGSMSSGSGDATQTEKPLIQNVHVIDGTVTGRNAGGIVGYTFVSEIRYCSVVGTRVSGLVNAGGVAAQSYSNINNCYANEVRLGALLYNGGIVATIPEAGTVSHCLTTYSAVCGRVLQDGKEEYSYGDTEYLTPEALENANFDTTIWNLEDPLSDSTFKEDAIKYNFAV